MADNRFERLRDWVEPAHPAVIRLHEELVAIFTHIREKYQPQIDKAFDKVSRQIGFVVATTVPVVLEVGNGGDVKRLSMGAENLQDTIFDRELSSALSELTGDSIKNVSSGTFNLHLLWYEALKLKLQTDWMEPAHFLRTRFGERLQPGLASRTEIKETLGRPWEEPAHWFDPGMAIAVEEAVLIEAIDNVYSELRLVERVAASRENLRRQVRSEVMEPAHFSSLERQQFENPEEVLRQIRKLLFRI